MPQPRRSATSTPPTGQNPPPDSVNASVTGPAAAAAAAVPATGAAAAPTAAGVAGAAALAAAAAKIIAALMALLTKRGKKVDVFLRQRLREEAPDMPEDEVEELARLEKEYEREFQRKVRERMRRDLPPALRIQDEAARRRAIQILLDRERRNAEARERAMLERALGAAERRDLKKTSPRGAYWKLSETVREHTADCLAMGEKFWPWEVLASLHPPRHHGCPCRLMGLAQAKAAGLMTDADIPSTSDAVRRAARLKNQWESLEEAGVDDRDIAEWVDELHLLEAAERGDKRRHAERWEEGTTKGGEFKPRRGGAPGRPTLAGVVGRGRRRALAKALPRLPKAPALSRSEGQWVWVKGRLTRIPEGPWEKRVGEHVYSSPAGGTNVYRDGELALEAGEVPLHPDLARPTAPQARRVSRKPLTPQGKDVMGELARREDEAERAVDREATAALARMDPMDPPVKEGEYLSDAIGGLERAGFLLGDTGSRDVRMVHPNGGVVALDDDGGVVSSVTWSPQNGDGLADRKESKAIPTDLRAFGGDVMAAADRVAAEQGTVALVRGVFASDRVGPLSSVRRDDGAIDVGREVEDALATARKARADGRDLTPAESGAVYLAYVSAHVAAMQGVNPSRGRGDLGAEANLNAALSTELGRVVARERLQAHGLGAVVGWADAHPDDPAVIGGWRPERAALASLLDDGGVKGAPDRLALLTRLKFGADGPTGLDVLADRLVENGQYETPDRAAEHVRLTLERIGTPDLRADEFDSLLDGGEPAHPDAPAGYKPPPTVPVRESDGVREVAGAEMAAVAELAASGDPGALWEAQQRLDAQPAGDVADALTALLPDLSRTGRGRPAPVGEHLGPDGKPVPPLTAMPTQSHRGLDRVPPIASASTGIRLDRSGGGDMEMAVGGFGRGVYFTSGQEDSQIGAAAADGFPSGVDLSGATMYRPGSPSDAARLERTLARIRDRDPDVRELALNLPPGADGQRDLARAELAIREVYARDIDLGNTAPTILGMLGFDGVDSRHLDGWDSQTRSSVLYPPRLGVFDTEDSAAAPHLIASADVDAFLSDIPEGGWAGRLAHGTSTEAVDAILAGGFDLDGARPGNFGRGIYAADPSRGDMLARYGSSQVPIAMRLSRPYEIKDDATLRAVPNTTREAADEWLRERGHDGVIVRDYNGDGEVAYAVALAGNAGVRVVEPEATPPAAGGAVVGGRAGRWVWIRGTYRHIPHGEAWEETADGVTFRSPADSTFVYRRVGDGPEELVAKPRWNGHPDTRNPSRGGTVRGAAVTPPPSPEPPVAPLVDPPTPEAPDRGTVERPPVAVGQRVRFRNGEGVVTRVSLTSSDVYVEAPDGRTVRLDSRTAYEVLDHGTPRPEVGPAIGETPWTTLVNASRPAGPGEVVPGVVYVDDPGQIMNVAKVDQGLLVVGRPFFDLDARARGFQIDSAMGAGLAIAIDRDDAARQRFGDLWTSNRFQATEEGRTLALDRHSLTEGIRQGYARLRATDWRDHAARYPDAMRAIALEAQDRGYPIDPEVSAWAAGRIGGPSINPARVNRGTEIVGQLAGMDDTRRGVQLRADGFRETVVGTAAVWRRFDSDGLVTVTVRPDGVTGDFAPFDDPQQSDVSRAVIARVVGQRVGEVEATLQGGGFRRVAMFDAYPEGRRSAYAHPDDPTRVLWIQTEPGFDTNRRVLHAFAAPGDDATLRAATWEAMRVDPLRTPNGTLRDVVSSGFSRAGWQPVPGDHDGALLYEKVTNPSDMLNATIQRVRVDFDETGRSTGAVVPDDFDPAAASLAYRTALVDRSIRVTEIQERMRVRLNAGGEPFTGTEDYGEVRDAFAHLGYGEGAPRSLQNGGQSITWKNARTGGKVIVRLGPADADGKRPVLAQSRVTAGARNYGRVNLDRLPANKDEFAADMLGWGDQIARDFGRTNDVRMVRWARPSDRLRNSTDHAGWHRGSDGLVVMGVDAEPALTRYLAARSSGETPSPEVLRSAYKTYKLAFHEMNHGIYGPRDGYFDHDGSKGIEEALTEELAHVQVGRVLRRHGATDILELAEREQRDGTSDPLGQPWTGTYMGYRQSFGGLIDRMGITDNDEKIALFETWKYQMSGADRRKDMARRIIAHEGRGTEAEVLESIRRTMSGSPQLSYAASRNFRPVLRPDFSQLGGAPAAPNAPGAPTPAPSAPRAPQGARATFSRGERVRVTPQRGRGFQGRIVEVEAGTGRLKVKKIGRGEEVWVDPARAAYLDGTRPGTTPPAPPSAPTAPAVPTARLNNGGVAGIGARTRGRSSGQLSTITGLEGGKVQIRRDDGSTYSAGKHELDLVAINDRGDELTIGSSVKDPEGGRDLTIVAIKWTDPQAPEVMVTGDRWVPARTLVPAGQGRGLVSLTDRAGRAASLSAGDKAVWSPSRPGATGGTVTLQAKRARDWPNAGSVITARVEDGINAGEVVIVDPGELRVFGELPGIPRSFTADRPTLERLGQQHFRRQASAGRTADGAVRDLSAQIADDLDRHLRAVNGMQYRRPGGSRAGAPTRPVYDGRTIPPERLFSNAYRDLFASQEDHDRLQNDHPKLYDAAQTIAGEAGLPWPNWRQRVNPVPPAPAMPAGTIFDEAVLRHAFTGTFGRRGQRTEVTFVSARSGSASVSGVIKNANGTNVGSFERRITMVDGKPEVYHAYMSIQRRAQGGGFASAFNSHAQSVYAAKGVQRVKVSANIDVGGYTWAATGFNWDIGDAPRTPEQKAVARATKTREMYEYKKSALTAAQRAIVEARLWDGREPLDPARHLINAWDLAHVGGGDHAIGKKLLLGRSWSGVKYLVPGVDARQGD